MAVVDEVRPIYVGTKLKYTVDIQSEGFSMADDDFAVVIKTTRNEKTITKADMKITAGEEYLLEELIDTCKDKLTTKRETFSKDVLFWMGYVYRYWHFYTKEESNKIYKQAPFETMNVNYLMFHTMDVEMAIDDLKEIFKQKK